MIPKHSKIIAVDFDGTIVKDAYPEIGKTQPFAFDTLKKFQKEGYRLILWTLRKGKKLDDAVAFCKKNGVDFYAVNKNYPDEELEERVVRKIIADVFIDDRNVGGFLGWGKIYQLYFGEGAINEQPRKRKGLFGLFK